MFLYEIHQYDVAYDDLRKWVNLPYHLAAPRIRRAAQQAKDHSKEEGHATISSLLLPAINKVLAATARLAGIAKRAPSNGS